MSYHSPSLECTLDDCDLDDAELWAVIDSAASSKSRKTHALAIKNSNPTARVSRDEGEVFQRRPPKIAKQSTADQRVAVVKSSFRSPITSAPSPPSNLKNSYCSPVIESPQSPAAGNWCCEERKENSVPSRHSLSGMFPSVSLFKQYQNAAMEILEKTDYVMISGNPFIKKSGWRKIAFYFNISFEIKDKTIEFDENRNVQRAEFVVRALMQGGRFADGWGSCERREKRFLKPNHDIPSTAETRAKNRACQDLLGIGECRPGVKV